MLKGGCENNGSGIIVAVIVVIIIILIVCMLCYAVNNSASTCTNTSADNFVASIIFNQCKVSGNPINSEKPCKVFSNTRNNYNTTNSGRCISGKCNVGCLSNIRNGLNCATTIGFITSGGYNWEYNHGICNSNSCIY